MFAPDVMEAYSEKLGRVVHWLNGTFKDHNEIMKKITNEEQRQIGWEQAVYHLACYPDGSPRYSTSVSKADFHTRVNHSWARTYGGLILGMSEGDEQTEFEREVEAGAKNSETGEQDTTSSSTALPKSTDS